MHRYQNLQSGFARFLPPFLSLSLSFSTATPVSYTPRDRIDGKEGICPGQFRFELFAIFFILFPLVYTCVCVYIYVRISGSNFHVRRKIRRRQIRERFSAWSAKSLFSAKRFPWKPYLIAVAIQRMGQGRGDVAIRKWRRRLLRGTMPMRTYLFERILFNFFPLEIYLKFPCCTSNRFLLYRVEIFVSTLYSLIVW